MSLPDGNADHRVRPGLLAFFVVSAIAFVFIFEGLFFLLVRHDTVLAGRMAVGAVLEILIAWNFKRVMRL